VSKHKLPPRVFAYVEHELYSYDTTKGEIDQLREDIITAVPVMGERVQSGAIGNTTQTKGVRLTSDLSLLKMERTKRAIDEALRRLDEEHAQVFEYKYLQKMDWRQVCMEIPISERNYFYKRKELVYMVAMQMGLMNP
jgi:RinA family phage transcriptional activator